jgi:hypothetical protein
MAEPSGSRLAVSLPMYRAPRELRGAAGELDALSGHAALPATEGPMAHGARTDVSASLATPARDTVAPRSLSRLGRRAATLVVTVLAWACAGCGGPIRHDELERGIESLASTAATGQLLAHQAAQGRVRDVFTRVQARALGESATHEAEKLKDAAATGDTAQLKRHATQLAQDISDALGALQVAPADRGVAQHTVSALRDATRRASDLEQRL